MTVSMKILLSCGLVVFLLTNKVNGRHANIIQKTDEAVEDIDKSENEDRGIISDIFRPSHTHVVQPQQQFVNIPAPPFIADQALAPVFQIPQDVATGQTHHHHRPSLIGGLLNILRSRELKSSEEKEKDSDTMNE